MILTSNLSPSADWDSAIAGAGVLTVAMLDRILPHSIIVGNALSWFSYADHASGGY